MALIYLFRLLQIRPLAPFVIDGYCKSDQGATVSWYHDPLKERDFHYQLSFSGWRLWLRFFMSFLVNGIGFHVLVHPLPVQVSAQSTFLMVVFRSVGMMHLVNMDDSFQVSILYILSYIVSPQ